MEFPAAFNKCIHQLFEAQVSKTPDDIAIVFENQQLTYQQLNNKANQLAHHLKTLGVQPDTLVGIYVERSLEMVVGLLGILKAGGAYVPLDPAYPQERIALMLEDSQAPVIVTQSHLQAGLPETSAQVVCLDRDWQIINQESPSNLAVSSQPENLAYTIYTSGSTGKPKGVQIIQQAVVNFLTSMQHQPGITAKDVLLAVTTISFDIAVLELFLPITVGAKVVIVSRQTAADPIELMQAMATPTSATNAQSQATIMQATPATWRMLLTAGWEGKPDLKILCGGEAIPRSLANQLLARTAALWNMYGPTETTIWSTVKNHNFAPLSFAQEPLWLLEQLEPHTSVYNLPYAVRLQGELNIPVLQQALDAIAVHHEAVRTNFIAENGVPRQVINPPQPVGVTENFFELGGHSLLAVRLMAQIEKVCQQKLPLAAMFPTPTIEQLATTLRQKGQSSPWYSIVPVQPKGSRSPLFGIHSTRYHALANYLGTEQPIYALRYGLAVENGENMPTLPEKMEDLAAHYIQEMRIIQPQGPYYLMGLCIESIIAFEMAQQLTAQGEKVAMLALFDPTIEEGAKPLSWQNKLLNILKIGTGEVIQRAKKSLVKKMIARNNKQAVNKAQVKYKDYVLKPYQGKAFIFKPVDRISLTYDYEPDLGWGKLINGGLEIHEIPGVHTDIFQEPNVQVVAEKLKECLGKI